MSRAVTGGRSRYAPVRVRVAFHGFWPGFSLNSFNATYPYLKLKYELIECRRRPDVRFVSVFSAGARDPESGRLLPDDGRPTVFYTGERVAPDLSRFDWSISFDETSERNLYLPGWVQQLNRLGVTPYSLVRRNVRSADGATGRRPCAYIFRNRVPRREAFFDQLARRMEIMSPGESRNNHPRIGQGGAHKAAFLRHFRFNIAFENEPFPGYLTEKIVDPFIVGCVPIYCGDPLVERTFSPEAFIHVRDESGYGEAIERIIAVESNPPLLKRMRETAPLADNRLPDHATHDYAMAFFERIFDTAVRRCQGRVARPTTRRNGLQHDRPAPEVGTGRNRAVAVVRSLGRGMRRFLTARRRRSHCGPVRVKVAFHGFGPGFSLRIFNTAHPYLKLKYELLECHRQPDVHFVGVFSPAGTIRNPADISLPGDGRTTVFYTGERVAPDLRRFDWSISFDEISERNLYLPVWVRHLNRLRVTPESLVRRKARSADAMPGQRPCAYIFRHRVPRREAFFDQLAGRMEIVSPGDSRNNYPRIVRTAAQKAAFLRRFRFNIAFENEPFPGYLTEKIVDPFIVGCVPIYHGDPLVERTFSPEAFLHVRDESDYGEAIERIMAVESNPPLLKRMRNAAPLVDNRLPDFATHDYAMAFFERIFDTAVQRG